MEVRMKHYNLPHDRTGMHITWFNTKYIRSTEE